MVKNTVPAQSKPEKGGKTLQWLLLGILGIALAILGFFPSQKNNGTMTSEEQRIASALSRIRGAGETHVVIYCADTNSFSTETHPTGALIITRGADDITVQLRLLEAAQTLLNLPPDAIRIYPMEE